MSLRSPTVLLALTLAFAAPTLAPTIANAQSAEVLIQQGLDLRRQHRDQEALERFQRAYEMSRSPRALAQIALAEQALGDFVQAELHLSQALAVQMDGWIASRRGQLEQALQSIRERLGTVELTGGVAGAQVFVNGQLRGTLPEVASLRVRAGTAVIEIRAGGYAPVQRQVMVTAGGVARENLAMIQAQGQGGVQVVQQQGQPVNTYRQPRREVYTHPNWALFGIGAGVFAGTWIGTWAIMLAVADAGRNDPEDFTDWDYYTGLSFVPVIGPLVLLIEEQDSGYFYLFLLDTIAQAAGLALAIIGLVSEQQEVTMALDDGPRAPTLSLRPLVTDIPDAQGVSVALTHF